MHVIVIRICHCDPFAIDADKGNIKLLAEIQLDYKHVIWYSYFEKYFTWTRTGKCNFRSVFSTAAVATWASNDRRYVKCIFLEKTKGTLITIYIIVYRFEPFRKLIFVLRA